MNIINIVKDNNIKNEYGFIKYKKLKMEFIERD